MTKVLISLRDSILSDVVKTAFKQFPSLSPHPVPRRELIGLAAEDDVDAVVVDVEKGEDMGDGIIRRLRDHCPGTEIFVLAESGLRDRMNKLKVSHSIFTVAPMPIDPFDLAKRIARLETLLANRGRRKA